jgi:hypothetical protein
MCGFASMPHVCELLQGLQVLNSLACRTCKGCSICLAYRVHMKLLEHPEVPATAVMNMDLEALHAALAFPSAEWPSEVSLHHASIARHLRIAGEMLLSLPRVCVRDAMHSACNCNHKHQHKQDAQHVMLVPLVYDRKVACAGGLAPLAGLWPCELVHRAARLLPSVALGCCTSHQSRGSVG